MRIALQIATAMLASGLCVAAHADCLGLDSIVKEGTPLYPPIAKAAHVQGQVQMTAHFASDGSVQSVEIISGPQMLQNAATAYVKTWQANPYSVERVCPVTVSFLQTSDKAPVASGRIDPQHVVVTYDPGTVLIQQPQIVIR